MKKIAFLCLIGLLWTTWACDEELNALKCDPDLACTEVFVTLTYTLRDNQDNAIILDNYYSQNLDNGNVYNFNNPLTANSEGVYAIISDGQKDEVVAGGTTIRFIGEKDGQIVAQQDFVVGHDCCHVVLISGPGN